MTFWELMWLIVISFALLAGLMVLFRIVTDLFKDPDASGFTRAAWVVALVFFPILGSIVYLVVRGQGMAERQYSDPDKLRSMAAHDPYLVGSATSASSRQAPGSDYERFKRPTV